MTQDCSESRWTIAAIWGRIAPLLVTILLALTICAAFLASSGHDAQRLLEAGFLLLFVVMVGAGGRLTTLRLPSRGVSLALLGVVALGMLSAVQAYSPIHAVLEVSTLVLLVLGALFIAGEMAASYDASLLLVLRISAIGAALYFMQVIVVWCASIVHHSQPDMYAFAPSFGNYRFLNHAQTVLLPLLALLCSHPALVYKKSCLLLAACWWSLLFVLAGRGTFFGLLAGTIGVLFLRRAHAYAYCAAIAKGALGGIAVYLIFFVCIPLAAGMAPFGEGGEVVHRSVSDPSSSRLALWSSGLSLALSHPWLGIGPMHYAHELKDVVKMAHPHDWAVQIAAEWGIPALLLLCFAIWHCMSALHRCAARVPAGDALNQGFASAWILTGIAILVDGLVSGLIVMPVSQMLITLYIGCATGWVWSMRRASPQSMSRVTRWCVAVLLLTASIGLLVCIVLKSYDSGLPTDAVYRPRYWLNGVF